MQPRSRTARIIFLFSGLGVIGLGLLFGLLEFLAIVDPVGTKMSDDADPLGDPTIPIWQHAIFVFVTLFLLATGLWLVKLSDVSSKPD